MSFKSFVVTELHAKRLLENIVEDTLLLAAINKTILMSTGSYCTFLRGLLTSFLSYSYEITDENSNFSTDEISSITGEFRNYLGEKVVSSESIYFVDGYDIFYHHSLYDSEPFNVFYYDILYPCLKECIEITIKELTNDEEEQGKLSAKLLTYEYIDKITRYFARLVETIESTVFCDYNSLEIGCDIFFLPEIQRNRLIIHVKVPREERTCSQQIHQKASSSD